jgi:hypothetical protein
MGNEIQVNGVAERFSSNTLSDRQPSAQQVSGDINALRARLIAATVEVLGEGGDPRLVQSRARP